MFFIIEQYAEVVLWYFVIGLSKGAVTLAENVYNYIILHQKAINVIAIFSLAYCTVATADSCPSCLLAFVKH